MPKTRLSDLIGAREAAAILGIDRSTLSRWSDEKLPDEERRVTFERLASGAKLYSRADVERLRDELAKQQASA